MDQNRPEDGLINPGVHHAGEEDGAGPGAGFCITRRPADEGRALTILPYARNPAAAGSQGFSWKPPWADCRERGGARRRVPEVRRSNSAAIGLYKKYGFTVAGAAKIYYAAGEDAVVSLSAAVKGA